MGSHRPDAAAVAEWGHVVWRKMRAVWGQGGLLDRSLASVLSLYGSLRMNDAGGDYDPFVDRHIAAWLFAGEMPEGQFQCLGMGGMAGAFRLVQGHYLTRTSGRELLRQHTENLVRHHPRTPQGAFWLPSPAGQGVRVETLLAVCPFLAMSGLVLRDGAFFREAAEQFQAAEPVLLDPSTGLFRHASGWHKAGQATPDAWARGNGYAVAALAETLRCLPEACPDRDALIERLASLLASLLPLQAPSGLWRQQLTDKGSPEEASGSALIALGLAAAIKHGWLGEGHLPAAWRAWEGLAGCVTVPGNANVSHVCVDTGPGESPRYYAERPMATNDQNGFGPLMMAASAYYELARSLAWRQRPAPVRPFQPPPEPEVAESFAKAHELGEAAYNGDGSWGRGTMDFPDKWMAQFNSESRGGHPLYRSTGHCVMGYLGALLRKEDETFARRVREGLDYLAANQEPDGSFRLFTRRREGQVNHNGCLYVTGICATALAKGYERFGEERWLQASAKAAQWEGEWPVVRNVNFNSFAVWHLAEHFRITGDEAALDAAVHKAKWRLMARQQVAGGWQGHDSWIWYHGIILRSYAALLRALPEGHALRRDLRLAALAGADYFARLQQPDGAMLPNPQTERPSASVAYAIASLSLLAQVLDEASVRNTLYGAVRYRISPASGDLGSSYNDERGVAFRSRHAPEVLYALGAYCEMLAETDGGAGRNGLD